MQLDALLRLLDSHDVEFIIVGGVAAVLHGSARLTQDLDVVYARTPQNLARLVEALRDHAPYLRGAPPGLPFQWSEDTLRLGLNFTLQTDLGALDLLGEIAGGGEYQDLTNHTVETEIFGVKCRYLDLKALIRAKRAAGRPKDLESLAELEAMNEDQRDT